MRDSEEPKDENVTERQGERARESREATDCGEPRLAPTRTKRFYDNVPAVPGGAVLSMAELLGKAYTSYEVEIGFGKGHFLLGRAAQDPLVGFLGMETRRKWVHLVGERLTMHSIVNAKVLYGDALHALSRMQPQACLARIYVNFPDPWWKARHEKRLVLSPRLMSDAARLLMDGGEIFVQTDVDYRADGYVGVLRSAKDFEPAQGDGSLEKNPFGVRSLREMKCEEVGLPVFRYLFRRKAR